MVIHEALLAAVQLQPPALLTVTVPSAAAGDVRVDENGESVNTQAAPGCVIVNRLPPIVSVPVRDPLLVFAATL